MLIVDYVWKKAIRYILIYTKEENKMRFRRCLKTKVGNKRTWIWGRLDEADTDYLEDSKGKIWTIFRVEISMNLSV